MKLFSNNALLTLTVSVAIQGSRAASNVGSTPRHSRLHSQGSSLSETSENVLVGHKAFEYIQSSPILDSHLAGANDHEYDEGNHHMEALGMSLMLIVGIAFQMSLFYLINFPHPSILRSTWQVLNTTSSIFISVMLYHMVIKSFLSSANHLQILAVTFAVCYLVNCALAYFLKASAETTQALAMISGHVTGFAAIYTCANLQQVTLFTGSNLRTGLWMTFVTVVAAVGLLLLALCTDKVSRQRETELLKKDADVIRKTQDTIFCMCISFSLVAIIRFCICGEVQEYTLHSKLKGISQAHANQLLMCGCIFGLAACLSSHLFDRLFHTGSTSCGAMSRVLGTIVQLQGSIFAWLVLFWAEWQLQILGLEGTITSSSLVVAFILTIFSCLAIFAFSYVANQATDSLELTLGLLVGLSWQRSCILLFEDLAEGAYIPKSSVDLSTMTQVFTVLLLLVVAPAWRVFILPRAMQLESMHEYEEQTLQKVLEAAAGKKVKSGVGNTLGWQFSAPRHFRLSEV